MTALLQFEIDKKRLHGFASVRDTQLSGYRSSLEHVYQLASIALRDTFDNSGTFVMVVSKEKITIVQRAEATDLNEKKPSNTKVSSERSK